MICILAVIIGVIYLGYRVVANGQN
jgi:hypothetical protein